MEIEYVIRQMEVYADEKGIPIMEKSGMKFLTEFIRLNNIKNVLEIGSAIGLLWLFAIICFEKRKCI